MPSIKQKIIGLLALTLAAFLIVPLSSAAAQEENSRGVEIIAGPHSVRVVLINSNLAAGLVQLALFITDASTGEVVPDARVILKASNDDESYEGWATAHNSPNMPERYDVRMNLGSTGEWVIDIDVSSSLGQGGTTAMTLEVPALNRYTDGSLVFFGVFALMMAGIGYIIWSTKRNNRRRREAAQGDQQA